MSVYTERLKKMQGNMDEQMADYTPGGFSLIPEGEYTCRVQATLDETKKDPKRLMVVWSFTVAEGNAMGKKVFDRTIIQDNKVGAQICRGRVEDLGYDWPEKVVDLEKVLEVITGNPPLVEIRVTHSASKGKDGKDYTNTNVRILDVLDGQPDDQAQAEMVEAEQVTNDDPNLPGLLALCGSYQLSYIDDSMNVAAIVAALRENGATFKEEDLQPEELTLLEEVNAEFIERKPVPPPAPARRVTQKSAPAKTPIKGKK